MAEIQFECLAGEQVHWNGVTRKRIHDQHIEILIRLLLQRQACIAGNDIHLRFRAANEIEKVSCQIDVLRIDFVKDIAIARLSITSYRANSQADRAYANIAALSGKQQSDADAGVLPVVGSWNVGPRWIQDFFTMDDGPVAKLRDRRTVRSTRQYVDTQNAVKIANH